MSALPDPAETLGPSLLGRLPADRAETRLRSNSPCRRDGPYRRRRIPPLPPGRIHRRPSCPPLRSLGRRRHQYPRPASFETLGQQGGLYTRLVREDGQVEARVIGSILSVVDSQASPAPALEVLASPEIDVITLTVTEKGYCHRPASGELDPDHPDIVHDLANPGSATQPPRPHRARSGTSDDVARPSGHRSRVATTSRPTASSWQCRAMRSQRNEETASRTGSRPIQPSRPRMVDRIAPATSQADIDMVEQSFGYRDNAVVVGEPFRQWVIENRFASRVPEWDLVGATFVDDVTPFEHLKMRILNGAQSTLCLSRRACRAEHTLTTWPIRCLPAFVRRMLIEESAPTLQPVPDIPPQLYVEQSLDRLRNTAIRHRNHQIATDGSQKIVQRLLNPIRERLRRGESIALLSVPVAAWMVYLIRSSNRFGRSWSVDDPYADRVAAIADRIGQRPDSAGRRNPGDRHDLQPRACRKRRVPCGDRRGSRGISVGPSRLPIVRASSATGRQPRS